MLSFFPRAVLDGIWDLIESAVSEGFSFLLFSMYHSGRNGLRGWSGDAIVLGKLPLPRAS